MPSWQSRFINTFTRSFLKPTVRFGSISSMRAVMAQVDDMQKDKVPDGIKLESVEDKLYDGCWVKLAGKRTKRVILYLPGGAFVMRSPAMHMPYVARICRAANANALMVHYRLAPEFPFPEGLEDCLAAYHDLLEQGVKPENITIAGDSAGGGLVLSTLLALRDEGSPMPANAIVISPLADLTFSGESRKFNKYKDPVLPNTRRSDMHELYLGDAVPSSRYTSPVFTDFDGLPPILGQVGSTEILLDDTVRAAQQARKAGVPFYLEIWYEMPHVFQLIKAIPESKVAIERIGEFIKTSKLDPLPAQYGTDDRAQSRRQASCLPDWSGMWFNRLPKYKKKSLTSA